MADSRALRHFIDAINVTGGVIRLPSGCVVPKGDEEWIDLGEAYLEACQEVGVEPLVEVEEEAPEDSGEI